MARTNWFDPDTNSLVLDEQVTKLDNFVKAMTDGIIEPAEVAVQEAQLVAAMKAVEPTLSDEQHEAVTKLLLELSAYNIMATMHETQQMRMRATFK